jgi:hypothetical protein
LALAGFEYHGPHGHLGFAPRLTPERFQCVFTGAEGWGTLAQRREGGRQTNTIALKWGRLRLNRLAFEVADAAAPQRMTLRLGGRELAGQLNRQGRRCVFQLTEPLELRAGETLTATLA